jgi:hypothetical protein
MQMATAISIWQVHEAINVLTSIYLVVIYIDISLPQYEGALCSAQYNTLTCSYEYIFEYTLRLTSYIKPTTHSVP